MFQKELIVNRKTCIWIVVATLIIAGVRFSDGNMLLAVASNDGLGGQALLNPSYQYIWDSPLKILLLEAMPPSLYWIAFVFACLTMLPILGLLTKEKSLLFCLFGVLVCVTPAIKTVFQNVGVGDGFLYLLVVVAVAANSKYVIFAAFVLLGLWHPQQAFFIGGSFFIYSAIYETDNVKERLLWCMFGLIVAALAFLAFKRVLGFEYHDRLDFVLERAADLLFNNVFVLPVSAFYLGFWVYITRRILPDVHVPMYATAWLFVLIGVSMLTLDVTRVLSIIALPTLLIPVKQHYLALKPKDAPQFLKIPLLWVVVSVLMPAYSWAGFDIFEWSDLMFDLCKYNVVCVGGY